MRHSTSLAFSTRRWRIRTSFLLATSAVLVLAWSLTDAAPALALTCDIDGTAVTTVASQPECDALVALYTSTDGPNWDSDTGWNTPTDPCGWEGVTCDAGVTGVDLFANSLTGPIPAEIGGLVNLLDIQLDHNYLSSVPPEIGDLSGLRSLWISGNQLSSLPPEIGSLDSLMFLDLSSNQLLSLPAEIGDLSGLRSLWISGNQLSSVPPAIGNLAILRELWLGGNQLSSLPVEVGNLINLDSLGLGGNLFASIPPEIGTLDSLSGLYLSSNVLIGDITVPMSSLQDTLSALGLSDGPAGNNCLTVSDPGLGSWLTSMAPDWDECDVVFVVGGSSVVSDGVLAELDALVDGSVSRWWGANRYATAAAISAMNFSPSDYDVYRTVFIATGENFPDALAAGPAAAMWEAPILLVRQNSVPKETAGELARLEPMRIVVVGGAAVVSDAVMSTLEGYTFGSVTRVWGANRYATAAAISASTFSSGVSTAYVATGTNFPDALAGGPAGVVNDGPILLVRQNSIPKETAAELASLNPDRIVVLGGPAAVSDSVVTQLNGMASSGVSRYWGANRYETAVAVSEAVFPTGAGVVFIVTGVNFPDAVAAGPVAGMLNAPILLVTGTSVPSSTASELERLGL
jgi:putative cell wall-binding protein